jgi:hydrogenase nickel incorporation protein HypA/HybF
MTQVVESILNLARERKAERIISVHLQVGDLTFLVEDQLKFAFEIITTNEGPMIEDAELTLEPMAARGSCHSCGFSGELKVVELPESHFSTPTLDCPDCGQMVEVTEGRDLLIRDIRLQVSEEGEVG